MEILAPAGNMEALTAAVRCGANAVYLGTGDFNARRNAGNFTPEELRDAVEYCHSHGVSVYLAVNTIVTDSQMRDVYATIDHAMTIGIDAFIIQDIGLAKTIHKCFPTARMHASTQCSATTPDGFRALEDMGFVRAVLPREMSHSEIAEIRRSCSIELEAFVHGALCMCVSGQCYLSAMLGGRSGNRGLCAQPCRMPFSADNSGSCDLSLKDLSLIGRIPELQELGVSSIKIEGRMKRPEYVAAAVTACRDALRGKYTPDSESTLRSVFSRSGFTDGYLTGERRDMFGTRQKEDVVAAAGVLRELAHLYEKERPLLPMDMTMVCRSGRPCTLTATANGRTVTITGDEPQVAINKPMTVESLQQRLSKLGGTQYYAGDISIDLEPGLIIPAGAINAMRRNAVRAIDSEPPHEHPQYDMPTIAPRAHDGQPYMTARFLHPDTIPAQHPFRRIFIPLWSDDEYFNSDKIGVEIPRAPFGREGDIKQRLARLRELGVNMALCPDIGAYRTAVSMGFDAYGDFGLNVFNSYTAAEFRSPILSYELTLSGANAINAVDTGIIAYGRLPLMLTRNCPVRNSIGCAECGGNGALTDRKGYRFAVRCTQYPCVEVLNPIPLYLGDRMDDIHTDFIHLYFGDESSAEVLRVLDMFANGAPYSGDYTRGLYYRGVK